MLNNIKTYVINVFKYFDRHRVIYRDDNVPYLERYYIFLRERNNFPFNIFIHKFLESDTDDIHDHPWDFFTIILWGGYWEYTKSDNYEKDKSLEKKWHGPLSFRYCKAEMFHKIIIDKKKSCWTLFIPFKQRKDWGFIKDGKWVNNLIYNSKKQT